MAETSLGIGETNRNSQIKNYWPLIVLIGVCALASLAINRTDGGLMGFMHFFMGLSLCVFAMLKLFNPFKFADGFQMYDLLAKPFRPYALVYPYIELALGLGYLSYFNPPLVYGATVAVFAFGAIGVVTALQRGLNINCPCMGNVLQVPLSTVTLTEDLAMAAMAAFMLFMPQASF